MKTNIFFIFLSFIFNVAFSQVNQSMGAPCKFSVYKGGVEIFHLGSLPATTGDTSYLCPNDSFLLSLTASGANCSCTLPQWQKNGVNIIGATSYTIAVIDTGMYSININCSPFSSTVNLANITKVLRCSTSTGIKTNSSLEFSLFPNPATEKIMVQFDYIAQGMLTIYNTLGHIVLTKSLIDKKTEIDISFLKAGVYFIFFNNGINTSTQKIIKAN